MPGISYAPWVVWSTCIEKATVSYFHVQFQFSMERGNFNALLSAGRRRDCNIPPVTPAAPVPPSWWKIFSSAAFFNSSRADMRPYLFCLLVDCRIHRENECAQFQVVTSCVNTGRARINKVEVFKLNYGRRLMLKHPWELSCFIGVHNWRD